MSKSAVDNISTRSDSDQARLAPIAGPLIDSEGFKRLHLTTFLGGLSPKFAHLVDAPVSFTDIADGSRGDHSIGVAALILDICNCLSLSQESCRYGVAWGLVHDIATWPLSHTGEAAFNKNSNVDAKTLRIQMIEGSKKLPSSLHLNRAIAEMGLDKSILISLLNSKIPAKSKSVEAIWPIIHSPVTPDTLEGIWRAGQVFGVDVPEPRIVASAIVKSLFGPVILKSKSKPILSFWRRKIELYKKIINSKKTISWESAWSFSIARYFNDIELEESLHLDEEQIIREVLRNGLLEPVKVQRYKDPLKYDLDQLLYRKRVLDSDLPILMLRKFLKKEKIEEDSLNWTKNRYQISKTLKA